MRDLSSDRRVLLQVTPVWVTATTTKKPYYLERWKGCNLICIYKCAHFPYIMILSDTLQHQTSGNICKKSFWQGKQLVNAWATEYKLNVYFTLFFFLWTSARIKHYQHLLSTYSLKITSRLGLQRIWTSCRNILLHKYVCSLISPPQFSVQHHTLPNNLSPTTSDISH